MVMSPSDVSKSTDMVCEVLCELVVFVAKVTVPDEERAALS